MAIKLTTTDPSVIVNAARCFSACVPIGEQNALKTYLLTQYAFQKTCVKPTGGPDNGSTSVTNTTLTATWTATGNSNAWYFFWGSAPGQMDLGSVILPVAPLSYTITGLSPGQTVYWTVFGLLNGCQGSFSTGGNGTTTNICASGSTFATAWATQVVANGGAAPSVATQNAIATFQCGLIADGLDTLAIAWNAIAADSLIAMRTPQLKGNGGVLWTNNNFVLADLTAAGLKGDGATKFLQTNGDPIGALTGPQNVSTCVYVNTVAVSANGRSFMVLNGTILGISTKDNTTNSLGANGGNPSDIITTASQGNGFYLDSRINAADHRLFFANGATAFGQIGATDVNNNGGNVLPGLEFYSHALNNGGGAFGFSAETIGFEGIWQGLTLAQGTKLFARVQTLMTAFGRNV